MTNHINRQAVEQYRQIFGAEKLQKLWQEFLGNAESRLAGIENKSAEEIRLAFHSLRSSSLVFGMDDFSKSCELVEELILSGENLTKIKKYIDKSKKIFDNRKHEVAEIIK